MPQPSPHTHSNSEVTIEGADSKAYKITVVGDGTVGKTCLLFSYTNNKFPTDYIPTIFEMHSTTICVDGVENTVNLWDTAGQEQFDRLRYLTYPRTDCFIICFSLEKQSSFENIAVKWYPELKRHCPNAALILVGTKSDLNEATGAKQRFKQAKKLSSRIKAYKYLECSARTRENLDQVFIEAVRAIRAKARSREKKRLCIIT